MRRLLDRTEIARMVERTARAIRRDHPAPFTVMVVLDGAFMYAADLVRHLGDEVPVPMAFMRCSSYGTQRTSSGVVAVEVGDVDLRQRDVLIVEDIVDTGLTLDATVKKLRECGARSVFSTALIDKPGRRLMGLSGPDYAGVCIEDDVFVAGYGMDDAGLHRQRPDVMVCDPKETR